LLNEILSFSLLSSPSLLLTEKLDLISYSCDHEYARDQAIDLVQNNWNEAENL